MIITIICWADPLIVNHLPDECTDLAKPDQTVKFVAEVFPRSQVVKEGWASFHNDKLNYSGKDLIDTSSGGGFTLEYDDVDNESLYGNEQNCASVLLSAKSAACSTGYDTNRYYFEESL